jgi:hypothetical protein
VCALELGLPVVGAVSVTVHFHCTMQALQAIHERRTRYPELVGRRARKRRLMQSMAMLVHPRFATVTQCATVLGRCSVGRVTRGPTTTPRWQTDCPLAGTVQSV